MDTMSMEGLLKAKEETLTNALRSDDLISRDRSRSVERLREALGDILLRYNAEHAGDKPRQAMADALTATANELFALLLSGTVETETSRRQVRPAGLVALLIAVASALAAVLLIGEFRLVGYGLVALSALGLFLAGRFWFTARTERYTIGIRTDVVWKTLCRAGETMDRKLEAFAEQERAWEEERSAERTRSAEGIGPEELELFADLLEALYSDNGDYSLRQLKKLRPYLQRRGVDIMEYEPANSACFELLPTKNETRTLRPALLSGDKLLYPGRAVERKE